jgi:hypothetical protein
MSKFFPEIADVLNRYHTLRDANSYLIDKHKADQAVNDNTAKELLAAKKFKENQLLNQSNEVAKMQLELEQRKARTLAVQTELDALTVEASDKSLELGQIISSVGNILERCEETFRLRHNKPVLDRTADKFNGLSLTEQCVKTKSKLDEIAMFMVDYRDIVSEFSAAAHDFLPLSVPKQRSANTAGGTMSVISGANSSLEEKDRERSAIGAVSMASTLEAFGQVNDTSNK